MFALTHESDRQVQDEFRAPRQSHGGSLREVCIAMRIGCIQEAEAMLRSMPKSWSQDAGWLNLMGVVHESKADWRRARRFYGKAMRADRRFVPARQNMRRWFELFTFGRTRWPVALGDEGDGD